MPDSPEFFLIGKTRFYLAASHLPEGEWADCRQQPDIDPELSLEAAIQSYQAQLMVLAASLLKDTDNSRNVVITSDLRSAILYLRQIER